jgi:hypothetical protein
MTDTRDKAREALEAQGFESPGPQLLQRVTDALAREEEGIPAGVRTFSLDPREMLADTPELLDRIHGPGTQMQQVVADVITKALRYVLEDVTDP